MVLEQFNSFHPRLQFISEFGGDEINFLDVTISINGNRFGFDWYRKSTFSGRFLNFYSNHPIAQKRETIFSLIDRTFLLSDFRFHTQNLTFIINILLDNDYPLFFIFDTINLRIKNWLTRSRRMNLFLGLRFHSSLSTRKSSIVSIKTTSGCLYVVLINWKNTSKYIKIFVHIEEQCGLQDFM